MISISDKADCCGCQACFEACPAHCISMTADNEGFRYPGVDISSCIDCGLCEKVCPLLHSQVADKPLACFAASSGDISTRLQSSSGGIFSLLAQSVIDRKGVVFGARFDESFSVIHAYTESMDCLSPFRGSKYVQSDLYGAYSQVQAFLREKRTVLFSGTPCQIAGLRGFLRGAEDENLLLVSVVCHGVPSPRVWKDYLASITQGTVPTDVNMRNKDQGWNNFRINVRHDSLLIHDKPHGEDPYMNAFLSNLTLRPACYACRFKGAPGSDLTLGDYWGVENIHPDLSDDQGTSLILVHSEKGRQFLLNLDLELTESRYEDAQKGNPCLEHSAPMPENRARFWKSYSRHGVRTLEDFTRARWTPGRLLAGVRNRIRRMI